ncbi:MAG: N-acetyltransferase family protein [Nitrospiraceae bacterium]
MKVPDLIIRPAVKADLQDILRLYAQPALDDGRVISTAEAEQIFERMARYPDYAVYVAVVENRIVGTFALLIMDNLGHMGTRSGIVEDVAVEPHVQGQGVGKAMMAQAIKLCREHGCYKMVISSNLKRPKAHAFYESLGFERHGYSFRLML